MSDIQQIGSKIGITSPRVLRKAEEFVQLLEIRSNSGSLSALKLPAGCTTVACIDLAASTCNHYADKANIVKVSGATKKIYTMCLKTIESVLDVQDVKTIRDLAVQFGCTGAVDKAQKVLKMYTELHSVDGDDMDFNTSLFQGAALCAACKKLKIKVDKSKVKELCAVKKSCFDTLMGEMEKIADKIEDAKQASTKKRVHTLIDEVERQMEALPEKKVRDETSDDVSVTTPADFAEWKRKILENAAKANS